MASGMGLLEARETAAQVQVEELREEAERVLAELAKAERVLERRAIARVELAEALAGPEPEADHPPESASAVAEAPVAGSVVPHWRGGLTMDVLAPDYQRLVGVLEAEAGGSGLRARELAGRLGLQSGGAVEGEAAGGAGLAGRGASRGCSRRGGLPGDVSAPVAGEAASHEHGHRPQDGGFAAFGPEFRARRRERISQLNVLSTTYLRGSTTNPLMASVRLTI